MGTALECWSTRGRSEDDDTVDEVLMRSHHRSDSEGPTPTTTTTTGMQKRFQKLSRNVSDAINSLKNSLNLESPPPHEAQAQARRKLVWASIVRSLTLLYPGSQLPDKLVSNIRHHYHSLPLSYAEAGFDIKDVFLHIRLLEQACAEQQPAFLIKEDALSVLSVTFASNSCVSWPALSSALDSSSLCSTHHQIFHTKSSTLGLLHFPLPPSPDSTFKTKLHNALRSAPKKPRFSHRKLPFALCGCQLHNACPSDFGAVQEDPRSSVEHSNPPIHLSLPLSSSSLLVSVDEWQTVRPSGPEVQAWLLTCDALDFTHQIGPTSFKGFYNAKRVAIDKLKGCDKGNAFDFVIRQDLLQLMTCAHRNLLPFYGVCVHEVHGLCVVTRFMEGGTLHDFVFKHKKIQIKDVVRIAIDIAEGLKFMNDHGVAYQDLNTQRVFLDRQGNACLGDMGIVSACKTGGEPMEYETDGYRWLAPEIIAADPESVKETWMSNVYSYGMLVWEMVTGEAAYSAYSPVQAAVGIAACGLRPDIPTDCPQLLTSLMLKCWNNCPTKRPQFSEILGILL